MAHAAFPEIAPLGLGNVSVPGPSLAPIFSGNLEEGGHFLDLPLEAGKQTPPPPCLHLPFPSAGSGGPGSPGPATLWASR